MNRFKVNAAKEKILKLREKYSKVENQEEKNSSSESLISLVSEKGTEQKGKPFQPPDFKTPVLPTNNDKVPTNRALDDSFKETTVKKGISMADLELHDKITQENKLGVSEVFSRFEKPLSSGSIVLSDLSNQFERIRFISSSSEDLSIVESENAQTKSVIEESSIKSKISSNKEIDSPKVGENVKQFDSDEKDSSMKTQAEAVSNDLTEISSVKESIDSEAGTENILHEKDFIESVKDSNSDVQDFEQVESLSSSSENNKIGEYSKNKSLTNVLEKKTLLKESRTAVSETSTESDSSKIYNFKNNHMRGKRKLETSVFSGSETPLTKTTPEALNLQSATGVLIRHNVDHGTNTDPVKITSLKRRSKRYQYGDGAYIKRSSEFVKKHENHERGKKQFSQAKQTMKKPFIKPCNLVNQDDIRKIESRSNNNQDLQSLRSIQADDFFYLPNVAATCGNGCEEVISMLLKNHIQLTRHFIKSHQRMYLQVCQAAQLLNENCSPIQ